MRVRYTERPGITGFAGEFNMHGLGEVILLFEAGDATSEEIKLLDVLLERPLPSSGHKAGTWVRLSDALKVHDVISDNYGRRFFEPEYESDKKRGWA